jgi:hypothetical protein
VYKAAIKGDGEHGSRGYYFAENGEHSLKQVADQIGSVLKAKGLAQSAEAKTLSDAELSKYMAGVGILSAIVTRLMTTDFCSCSCFCSCSRIVSNPATVPLSR